MGILGDLLSKVADLIDFLGSTLPAFNIDSSKLREGIDILIPYLQIANVIFPVQETIYVLGILTTFALAMMAFWAIQRIINLVRGAG